MQRVFPVMALLHETLPSPSTGESESASKLPGQARRLHVKYLYCLVCGLKNPGGFPRGVGATEIFPLRVEDSSAPISDVQGDVYPPQIDDVLAHHAAKIREWLQEITDMETFLHRFIEPVGSQFVYGPISAVPQARHSEPTAPDVHEDIVRY